MIIHKIYLDKIFSLKRREQVIDKLRKHQPTHFERLWLVGFLKYVGYTAKEVFFIIRVFSNWRDFDPDYTWYQVSHIFGQKAPAPRRRASADHKHNHGNSHRNIYRFNEHVRELCSKHNITEIGQTLFPAPSAELEPLIAGAGHWISYPNKAGFYLEWKRRSAK